MQRARVWRQHQRRTVENPDEVAQSAAERGYHRHASGIEDHAFRRELARRPAAHQHRLKPEVMPQRVRHLRPALGHPVLLRLARGHDDGCNGTVEPRKKITLRRALMLPRSEIPGHRFVRNTECLEELEVLVLYVLSLACRQPVRGEEPVEVARPCAVEAELHRCVRERGDDARLEVHLQREHHIEVSRAQRSAHRRVGAPSATAVELDDLVCGPVPAHERGGTGLEHPRDANVGRVPLEGREQGQDVHRVADSRHHHDAHAAEGLADHCGKLVT